MTRRRPESMDLEQLQRSLGRLPRPAARREFRDQLRGQFVSGAMQERDRDGARTWWLAPLRLAAMAAFAAALIVVGWQFDAGPAWKLVSTSGFGTVLVDGRPVPLDSLKGIPGALKPGARVQLPEGAQLDFELPGTALIQIVGGSEATLPGRPGHWLKRSMTASLEAGEFRISTGPAFHGTRFEVVTPELRAIVTGTTLAVFRTPDASCVCVFEGRVALLGDAVADTVHAGFRRSVYRDGSAPLLEPIRPLETMKLTMLRDLAARALER